jgi:superfamily II DNA or RNA helicase
VKRRVVLSPLSLLALRVYLHSRYTPCVNPSHSRINALSYQLDFVNYALRKLYDEGALRLLLADDVGLGKTIMTGLLIKELMLRGLAKRVLIVTPRFLTFQWRRELAEKFDIHCIEKDPRADCVVVSVDYLKRHVKQYLEEGWDLVVFDEAHNLTVGARGPTQRYSAAEAVASKARNVLLLSATPHHGKRHDFVARLRLLDPSVDESTLRAAVKRLVVRRLREDVKEEAGIPERYVSPPVVVEPTEEERRLYAEVIRYVKYYYDAAKQARGRRRRALGLVAVVFQKRASSSIAAIKKTVEKRIQALQQMKAGLLKPRDDVKTETEALRHVVADINAIDRELEQLHRLKRLAEAVKIDSKYQKLLELLERHKDSRVIIFTQYRDTMYYLAERLAASREVVTLHGGMTEEERKAAEDKFRRTGKILVATDAASEGLNLQVANVLINYDLPWNPSRLDQRIGRVHRYGQTKPVFVYNMLVADTIDGRVYQILLQKIEEIKKTLGKVFDYLGNVATEKEFLKIVEAALAGRSPEEEVDKLLRQRAVALRDLEELLTSDRIKIEADPRCTDVVTDDELKTLILNTLAALDPRSYEERGGCIKVKYLPRELGKFCRGRCLTEAAGFGGQCPERITVEHPLAKAVLEYHISQLPSRRGGGGGEALLRRRHPLDPQRRGQARLTHAGGGEGIQLGKSRGVFQAGQHPLRRRGGGASLHIEHSHRGKQDEPSASAPQRRVGGDTRGAREKGEADMPEVARRHIHRDLKKATRAGEKTRAVPHREGGAEKEDSGGAELLDATDRQGLPAPHSRGACVNSILQASGLLGAGRGVGCQHHKSRQGGRRDRNTAGGGGEMPRHRPKRQAAGWDRPNIHMPRRGAADRSQDSHVAKQPDTHPAHRVGNHVRQTTRTTPQNTRPTRNRRSRPSQNLEAPYIPLRGRPPPRPTQKIQKPMRRPSPPHTAVHENPDKIRNTVYGLHQANHPNHRS